MMLKRHGERGEVLREQPGATDEYGKPATTYQQVATEAMYRSYTLDTAPELERYVTGPIRVENPRLYLRRDSVVEQGDRVRFPVDGQTYEIGAITTHASHKEAETMVVQP